MSKQRQPTLLLMLLAAAGLCACDRQATTQAPVSTEAEVPPVIRTPDAIARAVVAERLGIAASEVQVVSVTPRDFPDSSLDCPEPGMSYLQVITPGYEVILEAEGRRFDVRVSGPHGRICHRRKPGPPPTLKTPRERIAAVESAMTDLAQRLNARRDSIALLAVQPLDRGTNLSGCETLCGADVVHCGYLIELLHDGRTYRYQAAGDRVMPCPPILPS